MILCATCGKENAGEAPFCRSCGHELRTSRGPRRVEIVRSASPGFAFGPGPDERTCPACAALVPPGFAYCGSCGASVPSGSHGTASGRPSRLRARLVGIEPDGSEGASWHLDGDEFLAGRSVGPVRLSEDEYVSPRHCRFFYMGERLHVQDLDSLNGVYRRVRGDITLNPGDHLRLGRQLLRIEPMEPAPRLTPEGTRMWGSPDPGYRARLIQLLEGGGVGEVFPLETGDNLVGREQGDIAFPGDRFVSSRHAVISVAPDGVRIRDLGSSNGTFVRLTAATPLDSGDALLLGGRLLRVELRSA
ncbi:FHA domain-containing protein [Vulgatibacter incomptus]|uniref:FHA domain protein n=1 Tax=Vulgatibacter incomptus TaxID=1391653 RepID=A0A0K1PC57_9BACT|nr:FHA domain-containing protein [Vulgatibacter incomptus]AKU90699.1 FHA domain protein [Vulgatibacter incomptus]